MGFAFSPPRRMAPIAQLLATAGVCVLGTLLTVSELPTENKAASGEGPARNDEYHRLGDEDPERAQA